MALPNVDIAQGATKVVTLHPLDAGDQPGSITGSPTVTSEDLTLVTISNPGPDGLTATLNAQPKPGVATVDAAGISSNGQPITSQFTVTVLPNPADHFGFSFA